MRSDELGKIEGVLVEDAVESAAEQHRGARKHEDAVVRTDDPVALAVAQEWSEEENEQDAPDEVAVPQDLQEVLGVLRGAPVCKVGGGEPEKKDAADGKDEGVEHDLRCLVQHDAHGGEHEHGALRARQSGKTKMSRIFPVEN